MMVENQPKPGPETTQRAPAMHGPAAVLLVALLSLLPVSLTAAPNWSGDWYYTPMVSQVWTDSDRDADDGIGLQLLLGKRVSERFSVELRGHYTQFDLDAGGDQEQRGLGLDLLYFLDRTGRVQTFILGGGGVIQSSLRGRGDDADQALEMGAGFLYRAQSGNWFWRSDLRFRNEVDSDTVPGADGFDDWVLSTGIQFPLGR